MIVAIDDDVRVRESIGSLVESAGYTLLLFSSAEEFLDSGALAATACLITDVRMQGIGGIELQHRLHLERPELPVILISAHYDDDIRRRALDQGAIKFFYKPFDAADLLRVIEAALSGSCHD